MKTSNKNGVAAALRTAAMAHCFLTVGVILCVAASVAASLLPPLLLARCIDSLTAGLPLTIWAVLAYFASLALEGVLSSAQESLLVVFGQKMTHALRSEMSHKLTRLPAATLVDQNPGEVAARFSGDVDTVEALFTSGIISMVADACRIISIMAVIFVKNPGLALILLLGGGGDSAETSAPTASSNDGRVKFLTDLGWDVTTSPTDSSQVRIPAASSDVFERYNALQKSQGYDLSEYAGKKVMRYVYKINNYPGATEPVYATLLVYKNQIIGGDVTDTAAQGKIRGFKMPEATTAPTAPSLPTETAATAPETTQ